MLLVPLEDGTRHINLFSAFPLLPFERCWHGGLGSVNSKFFGILFVDGGIA